MIHSSSYTVLAICNIISISNFLCFTGFEKNRTDICENNDHFRLWLWVALVDHYNFQLDNPASQMELSFKIYFNVKSILL